VFFRLIGKLVDFRSSFLAHAREVVVVLQNVLFVGKFRDERGWLFQRCFDRAHYSSLSFVVACVCVCVRYAPLMKVWNDFSSKFSFVDYSTFFW